MRVFKYARFSRFARKENISDSVLWDTIRRAENGQIDADLGGGVIKQRVPRKGQGKRGGYRTLILYRAFEMAFFIHGFAKSGQDNISGAELLSLKILAETMLTLPEAQLKKLLEDGVYTEVPQNGG